MPPRKSAVNINDAVLEVMTLASSELERNRVKLQPRLSSTLPLVVADRVQLQQVILNLVVNAIEAMSGPGDGPRELTVVSGGSKPGEVFVEVRDSGPGLDPAALDHLFDSFYTTKPNGTGMGLAICRSIVEAHSGRISAAANKILYQDGIGGLPKDDREAVRLFKLAADQGHARGQHNLGAA